MPRIARNQLSGALFHMLNRKGTTTISPPWHHGDPLVACERTGSCNGFCDDVIMPPGSFCYCDDDCFDVFLDCCEDRCDFCSDMRGCDQ